MSWSLLIGVVLCLSCALVAGLARRAELRRISRGLEEIQTARERGSHRARLQYPHIDLSRCLGCGTCIQACPEEGVLELIHGQALVVHGARCVGHGKCAEECPVGAIALTLGDISKREDIPVLSESFESVDTPGLFLAGEVTGYALIRTAIEHGASVAREVSSRVHEGRAFHGDPDILDLCIVGAGPAGLSCGLAAKGRGLSFVMLDQESLGGTVSKYPRRKLVMTQPVELPLVGQLKRTTWTKEELMELWSDAAREHELPLRTGQEYAGLEWSEDEDVFLVRTQTDVIKARHVCLAMGRRGSPRKLGVPGEELPKVAYSLLDAQSYQGRRILVVGGGDSAVEAAMGLAEQPGNVVTLSYRKSAFFRIKARNEKRLEECVGAGRLKVLYESSPTAVYPDTVELRVKDGEGSKQIRLENDEVFVMAGGIPPFKLLEASGISFDQTRRPAEAPLGDQGTGILKALAAGLLLSISALLWVHHLSDYYDLDLPVRPIHALHQVLRPSRGIGLLFGFLAAALVVVNLAYLLRRWQRIPFRWGSLKAWMTSHVFTGILAFLMALLHSAMAPRNTVGGHALMGLAVLVATGAIGRYFYSFVPRAANGRELALDEVKARLSSISGEWDQTHREFANRVRDRITELVAGREWKGSFLKRLGALLGTQVDLRHALVDLKQEGIREGVAPDQLMEVLGLARRAHRAVLLATHFEDLRGLLSSWRYLHRWVALLMVILLVAHIISAVRFAEILPGILS